MHSYHVCAHLCVGSCMCCCRKPCPCPSYSRRRDRNICLHWRTLYKGGGYASPVLGGFPSGCGKAYFLSGVVCTLCRYAPKHSHMHMRSRSRCQSNSVSMSNKSRSSSERSETESTTLSSISASTWALPSPTMLPRLPKYTVPPVWGCSMTNCVPNICPTCRPYDADTSRIPRTPWRQCTTTKLIQPSSPVPLPTVLYRGPRKILFFSLCRSIMNHDTLVHFFAFMCPMDYGQAMAVCKTWYKLLDTDRFWAEAYCNRWRAKHRNPLKPAVLGVTWKALYRQRHAPQEVCGTARMPLRQEGDVWYIESNKRLAPFGNGQQVCGCVW